MDLEREKTYAFNNGKQEGTQQKALELEKLLQLQAEMK